MARGNRAAVLGAIGQAVQPREHMSALISTEEELELDVARGKRQHEVRPVGEPGELVTRGEGRVEAELRAGETRRRTSMSMAAFRMALSVASTLSLSSTVCTYAR